jgi:putative hydrolase of the HAD superfamily
VFAAEGGSVALAVGVVERHQFGAPVVAVQEQHAGPGTRASGSSARSHASTVMAATPQPVDSPEGYDRRPMIVAFDADDTLWHNEDQFDSTHRAFEALLAPWASAEAVDARLYETEMRNLARYGYGAKSFMLSMTETAIDLSDGEISGADIGRIIELGHAILDRPIELLDDVVDVLDRVAHHTLMLITKGDLYAQHARIAESGLADRFWRIEVVGEKDVATYARVLELHQVPIHDFVMVGNSLRSDVLPVIELGGRAVHVPYHVTWTHEVHHDDHGHDVPVLEHLRNLPALIEEWT